MKIMLIIAALGCILCGWCDIIITYTPNGRFKLDDLKDNEKLAARFDGMPTSRHINSMLWGLLALAMQVCGYFALADNFRESSQICAMIMAIGAVIYISFGAAHHIICGLIEWFYIKFDRTEKARTIVLDFFKKTSVTMVACYLGLVMISVAMFIAIVTGGTTLPAWACIFNPAVFYIALAPFRVPATGNIAGAITFIGLTVVSICGFSWRIDKMSIVIAVLFSYIVFKEKLGKKALIGLILMVIGTLALAVWA